jgi:hypothetical protein
MQNTLRRSRAAEPFAFARTMNPVSRPQLARLASKAGLQIERWREGTVRFTLPGAKPPWDITPDWFRDRVTTPVYLVGRETSPTLADTSARRAQKRFPLLTKHRVVSLDSGVEVAAVAATLLAAGWCLTNDAYLFPADGGWLAYVGHHNELVIYVR